MIERIKQKWFHVEVRFRCSDSRLRWASLRHRWCQCRQMPTHRPPRPRRGDAGLLWLCRAADRTALSRGACLIDSADDATIDIVGVTGTSAGAMNGAVLVDGLVRGGPEQGRAELRRYWGGSWSNARVRQLLFEHVRGGGAAKAC